MKYQLNMKSLDLLSGVLPWDYKPSHPIPENVRNNKLQEDAWINDPSTEHWVYTFAEGANPNKCITAENADGGVNPIRVAYALINGGKLTENLVQATARDVFATHLLALEKNVGPVIFHVHDEAIVEVDKDVSPRVVEAQMSVTPEWLPGCPLSAEGQEAAHYLK